MKNAIAFGWNNRMVLSPHIGNLDSPRSMKIFEQMIKDLQDLYSISVEAAACDAHPGYASSRWATQQGLPLHRIYHHRAHASALAFESGLDKTWLTFTWDGLGLGEEGTLWGGEALHGRPGTWQRVATFRAFRLPGGERASREPWRSAAALCWEDEIDWHSNKRDATLLKNAWQHGLNSHASTSAGRLFDAAANLLGLCDSASFEGQAAMLLEAHAKGSVDAIPLPMLEDQRGLLIADWGPLLRAFRRDEIGTSKRAMQFHHTLAHAILEQAKRIYAKTPFDTVGLTGGVFQNRLLTELACEKLEAAGFSVHSPAQVPCNDGGLALGQLIETHYG
jgi:hydrogenase maturation protein HypF